MATAQNLQEFDRILSEVDASVVEHHLMHGDFSRWILGTVQDRDLAASIGAIGRDVISRHASDLLIARERIRNQLASRYALQPNQANTNHQPDAEQDPP